MKISRIVWGLVFVAFISLCTHEALSRTESKSTKSKTNVQQQRSGFFGRSPAPIKSAGPNSRDKIILIKEVLRRKPGIRKFSHSQIPPMGGVVKRGRTIPFQKNKEYNGIVTNVVVDAAREKIWVIGKGIVEGQFVVDLNRGQVDAGGTLPGNTLNDQIAREQEQARQELENARRRLREQQEQDAGLPPGGSNMDDIDQLPPGMNQGDQGGYITPPEIHEGSGYMPPDTLGGGGGGGQSGNTTSMEDDGGDGSSDTDWSSPDSSDWLPADDDSGDDTKESGEEEEDDEKKEEDKPIPPMLEQLSQSGADMINRFFAGADAYFVTISVNARGQQSVSFTPATGSGRGGDPSPIAASVAFCPEDPKPSWGSMRGVGRETAGFCGSGGEPVPWTH